MKMWQTECIRAADVDRAVKVNYFITCHEIVRGHFWLVPLDLCAFIAIKWNNNQLLAVWAPYGHLRLSGDGIRYTRTQL